MNYFEAAASAKIKLMREGIMARNMNYVCMAQRITMAR